MSIFGAFSISVAGMAAQSSQIGLISQNIANLDTVGYKSLRGTFANLIGQSISNTTDLGGVRSIEKQINSQQGTFIPTFLASDIAIDGNGFFTVKQTPTATGLFYTRDGSFQPDQNGDLHNNFGYYLQAWKLDSSGNLPASPPLETVNLPQVTGSPVATTVMALHLRLKASQAIYTGTPAYDSTNNAANMAGGVVQPAFVLPLSVIDDKGVTHTINASFLKTAANTWAVELIADKPSEVTGGVAQIAAGTLTFNGDGTLAGVSSTLTQLPTISWTNNATPSTVALNWGTAGAEFGTPGATLIGKSDGLSQSGTNYQIDDTVQDGLTSGKLIGLEITPDGFLVANYDNGVIRKLYMLPLTKFLDPDTLIALSGTLFIPSQESSAPALLQPGQRGAGELRGGALERSNTDQAAEMTSLIIAQRSYQMSSQVITKTDDMLARLTDMIP